MLRLLALACSLAVISCANKESSNQDASMAEIARLTAEQKKLAAENARLQLAQQQQWQAQQQAINVLREQQRQVQQRPPAVFIPPAPQQIQLVTLPQNVQRKPIESFSLGELEVGQVSEFKYFNRKIVGNSVFDSQWIEMHWYVDKILNSKQVILAAGANRSLQIVAQQPTNGMANEKVVYLSGRWEVSGTMQTGGKTLYVVTPVSQ